MHVLFLFDVISFMLFFCLILYFLYPSIFHLLSIQIWLFVGYISSIKSLHLISFAFLIISFIFYYHCSIIRINNATCIFFSHWLLTFFPFSGSATLQHWQELAQPNLGGILDPRPGVVPKGYRPLELDLEEVYQYADYEEDEPGDQYFQNLPTTTTPNLNVSSSNSHVPSPSPSPCLSAGHSSIEFSSKTAIHAKKRTLYVI